MPFTDPITDSYSISTPRRPSSYAWIVTFGNIIRQEHKEITDMTLYAYAYPARAANRWLAAAGRGLGHRYLRLNVRDEGEVFVLTAPVPGLKAEDLKIQ